MDELFHMSVCLPVWSFCLDTEMPIRSHFYHQFAQEFGFRDHTPLWSQFLQAAQVSFKLSPPLEKITRCPVNAGMWLHLRGVFLLVGTGRQNHARNISNACSEGGGVAAFSLCFHRVGACVCFSSGVAVPLACVVFVYYPVV